MIFGSILADCPWTYGNWTDGKNGAAASAMATMENEDLAALPVKQWADPSGCFLFSWATLPKLQEGLAIPRMWGFEFVTAIPWLKLSRAGEIKSGVGFWARQCAELLTVWRLGKPVPVRDRTQTPVGLLVDAESGETVFYAPPGGKHSAKPLAVHSWIEGLGNGPFLELFAREQREGWTCWGYDLGQEIGSWGVREFKQ